MTNPINKAKRFKKFRKRNVYEINIFVGLNNSFVDSRCVSPIRLILQNSWNNQYNNNQLPTNSN